MFQVESEVGSHHVYREISREEIRARLQDPALLLVDVMPNATYETGHLPGSINLPVEEIDTKARAVLPDPTREIAVYCAGPD